MLSFTPLVVNLYAADPPVLVFSQFVKRAASFQLTLVAGLSTPRVSFVICNACEALNFEIMSSLTSYLPMLYAYATEPAGFGAPVVSSALPALPIATNSMLNVLPPLPKAMTPASAG